MKAPLATLTLLCLPLSLAAQERWTPARLDQGLPPPTPFEAIAGGEVFLELTVSATGSVVRVDTLRTSPPFTDAVSNTVRGWRFRPAEQTRERLTGSPSAIRQLVAEPIESKVLVAAIYRPPALHAPTLGEPPRNVASAAAEIAYPRTTTSPNFPPLAVSPGTVLLEVAVGADGRIADASIVRPAAGFDEAALDAARQWTFQPARIAGRFEATYVYLVMSFRPPVTSAPRSPPR